MTNDFENNMQNFELQQKQMMMMNAIVNKNQKKLPPEVIKQLKKDYVHMYFGFVSVNWGQGKTLGMAWQKALEQMDGFVASKTKIAGHPLNEELVKMHGEFRREMAKTIMTNPYVNEKLDERLKKQFLDYGTKSISESKKTLDSMYAQYMPEKTLNKNSNTKSFEIAKLHTQKMIQQMLLQQSYQRAA